MIGNTPGSLLTLTRPDIWARGIMLAATTTGMIYAPKMPAADGTIYACGGEGDNRPSGETATPEEKAQRKKLIEDWNKLLNIPVKSPADWDRLEEVEKKVREGNSKYRWYGVKLDASSVVVPEGAMEWLLHEVGHYVAASPKERRNPNYGLSESEQGHDGEREIQAWAFEQMVLEPFGCSRDFTPPTQRDGAAFRKSGPLPQDAFRHVERNLQSLGLELEPWRLVWGDWVRWGKLLGHRAPWAVS